MAFAPDGSLWVGHTKHTWAGSDGIQRIVWDGQMPFDVHSMKLTKDGFRFTFTEPVDKASAQSAKTWPFKRYYYQYHAGYGSKQYDVSEVAAAAVRVLGAFAGMGMGRSVFCARGACVALG